MDLEVQLDSSLTSRDCFVRLPPRICRDLDQNFLTLRVTVSHSEHLFVGWSGGQASRNGILEVPVRFASCLCLAQGQKVRVEAIAQPPSATQIIVSSSAADWDVVLLNAQLLEDIILAQIRIVFDGMKIPVVLGDGAWIVLTVTKLKSTEENASCLLLDNGSEVAIAPPKNHKSKKPTGDDSEEEEDDREATFRGRVFPSSHENPFLAHMNPTCAKRTNFREHDSALLIRVDSSSGAKHLNSALHVTIRMSSEVPVGHIALHESVRRTLEAPALSVVCAVFARRKEAQAVSSIQLHECIMQDGEAESGEVDQMPEAFKAWLSDFDREKFAHIGQGSIISLPVGNENKMYAVSFNGETFQKPVRKNKNGEDEAEESFDQIWKPRSIMEKNKATQKQDSSKISLAIAPTLFCLRRDDVENGGLAISTTSPLQMPKLLYADLGWGQGPRLRDLCGSEIREAVVDSIACLSPVYSYSRESSLLPPLAVLALQGPDGAGKSVLAASIARELREDENVLARTVWVRCRSHKGEPAEISGKRIRQAMSAAFRCRPALVVLDDFTEIAAAPADDPAANPHARNSGGTTARALVDSLTELGASENRIAVLITCKTTSSLAKEILSPGVLAETKTIPTLSEGSRAKLFAAFLKRRSPVEDLSTDQIRELELAVTKAMHGTEGYTPTDLFRLADRVMISARGHAIAPSSIQTGRDGFTPAALKGTGTLQQQDKQVTLRDVGGLHGAKRAIREALEYPTKYSALFSRAPLRAQTGCLVFGPSGCGKTFLVRAATGEFNLRMISIKGPELLNKYIGSSEAAVRDAFSRASAAKPCILFFDEFESVAPKRGGDTTGVSDRVVNTLLTAMDGVEGLDGVFVIAATSRPDLIDPALLRPGRLDKWICADLPNELERKEIFETIGNEDLESDDIDFEALASATEGFTGADLQSVVYSARLKIVHERSEEEGSDGENGDPGVTQRRIGMDHMTNAIKESRPSISSGEYAQYVKQMERFYSGQGSILDLSGPKPTNVSLR